MCDRNLVITFPPAWLDFCLIDLLGGMVSMHQAAGQYIFTLICNHDFFVCLLHLFLLKIKPSQ